METDALLFMRKELKKAKDEPGKLRMIAKIARVRESTLTRILDGTTKEPKEHTTRRIINALLEVCPDIGSEYNFANILPFAIDRELRERLAKLTMADVDAIFKMMDILGNKLTLDAAAVDALIAVLDSIHDHLVEHPEKLEQLVESLSPKKKPD